MTVLLLGWANGKREIEVYFRVWIPNFGMQKENFAEYEEEYEYQGGKCFIVQVLYIHHMREVDGWMDVASS
jgi:hypothetical protein